MKIIYRANDGTEFFDMEECADYESMKANDIFKTTIGKKDIRLFNSTGDELEFNLNPKNIDEVNPPSIKEFRTIYVRSEAARERIVSFYEMTGDTLSSVSIPEWDEFTDNSHSALTYDSEIKEWVSASRKLACMKVSRDRMYEGYKKIKRDIDHLGKALTAIRSCELQ